MAGFRVGVISGNRDEAERDCHGRIEARMEDPVPQLLVGGSPGDEQWNEVEGAASGESV